MAHITDDEIVDLAKLSSLSLTEDEVVRFRKEIEAIIGYFEQLESVDVSGLEPTAQVSNLVNVMREDEIRPQVPQAELLNNAPAVENNLVKVKRVLN